MGWFQDLLHGTEQQNIDAIQKEGADRYKLVTLFEKYVNTDCNIEAAAKINEIAEGVKALQALQSLQGSSSIEDVEVKTLLGDVTFTQDKQKQIIVKINK